VEMRMATQQLAQVAEVAKHKAVTVPQRPVEILVTRPVEILVTRPLVMVVRHRVGMAATVAARPADTQLLALRAETVQRADEEGMRTVEAPGPSMPQTRSLV
jgi:hypothetical protein